MTGRDLLNALRSLTEEQLENRVHLYLQNSEDGEMASYMRIRGEDEASYYKGDNPWQLEDAKPDEQLIVIQ